MKKLTSLIIMMEVGLMLTACQAKDSIPAKYQPKLNPHPKYFMTVKGKIDPALKGDLQLTWYAYFYTTNPKCDKTVNYLEGVTEPLSLRLNYALNVQKNGSYQVKIPLDYYLEGKCGWVIGSMYYQYIYLGHLRPADANTSLNFSNQKSALSQSAISENWRCGFKKCDFAPGSTTYISEDLNAHSQHTFTLNFVKEGGYSGHDL